MALVVSYRLHIQVVAPARCSYCPICSPELEVSLWEHGTFMDPDTDGGPSTIIEPSVIFSQACRITLTLMRTRDLGADDDSELEDDSSSDGGDTVQGSPIWATIGLTRVRVL